MTSDWEETFQPSLTDECHMLDIVHLTTPDPSLLLRLKWLGNCGHIRVADQKICSEPELQVNADQLLRTY